MTGKRQYSISRELVDKYLARLRERENLTPEQEAIYLRGLRNGFKLCGVETQKVSEVKTKGGA